MPIYAFECRQCHKTFEELVPRMDGVAPCPHCSGTDVRRLISAPADYRGSTSAADPCPTCPSMPAGACPGGMCGL